MSPNNIYQQQTLAGATGIELILSLYDGAVQFLYRAMQASEAGDVEERRFAVKRTLDILMYLQARLRPDIGGKPAEALAEFYTAMFYSALEASHAASPEKFRNVIANIQNVREAWAVVARDPEAGRILPRELRTPQEKTRASHSVASLPLQQTPRMAWSA